ncbi:4Fe-4S binding protein [Saccharicrinis fermentans]|uniref:Periplasmic [Fe] hydrogenase large subunit n=1 Tax=Saccharicrinis fermentans DSM 9555 = JCM 21142 TaxID=869213 RepID=W7YBP9_9BACT|nr:periplasmic [Fe] hydrogenase large subunit [Saccharicrinis fermentans DSM 9555 = JCM 21142]
MSYFIVRVDWDKCILCESCELVCPTSAIIINPCSNEEIKLYPSLCTGCQACLRSCPTEAIYCVESVG